MTRMTEDEFRELVYKCALINAVNHKGSASVEAVGRMVHNELMKRKYKKHGVVG